MTTLFPFSLTSPAFCLAAFFIAFVCGAVVFLRRPAIPSPSHWLCGIGMILICLSAGRPLWQRPSPGQVAVMVDLSPSTRTADFRTRAVLNGRIHSLLGKTPYRIYYFATDATRDDPGGEVLPDIAAERTIFKPPAGASAVVLFSDGRFDPPAATPPTYVVVDPLLETPTDAAVASLATRGGELLVNVTNNGAPRTLTLGGVKGNSPAEVVSSSYALARTLNTSATAVSARLSPGDAWPENDQLAGVPPPAENRQRWWVGASAPGGDWRIFSPGNLPTDGSAYLAPSIIVLENIAAGDLSALQQQRLGQYVRELGGGLIILGGDRAFAAGAYPGSELEALSPLASTAPRPTTHWLLLADGSGSMNQVQAGISLWHQATDAMVKLIPALPPDDLLSTGSFAEGLTWWTSGKSVRESASIPLPPANVTPHGPTNLEDVLLDIAKRATGEEPRQLLLLTDADAEIKSPAGLEAALRQKKIHLHLLAITNGSALPALRPIVRNTGGTIVKEFDPQKWAQAAATLMREASPKLLGHEPLAVHFEGELASIPALSANPWNHTWLKPAVAKLAGGAEGDAPVPAAARWNVGEGRVLALVFDPGPGLADTLAASVGQPPRDPHYRVTWESAARLRVSVDALDDTNYLNNKAVQLELSREADTASAASIYVIPQTAPGRYELELPAPRQPSFAAVRVDGKLIDRIAVAGRYAQEFDAVGNDHEAMEQLSRQTGGGIIAPRQTWPIDFRWPDKSMGLTSILAILGASLIAIGLAWWKMAG